MQAEFQTSAAAFMARTGDGPGVLAGGVAGRFLNIQANNQQQRFTKYLATDRTADKHWEYFEALLQVDGSSGYRLYRVGLRGFQTPLTLNRFSEIWAAGIGGNLYYLAKPTSLAPDAQGWVWSEWHYDPAHPKALYTGTDRRAEYDTSMGLQLRTIFPSLFASRKKTLRARRKQLLVGNAATDFAQREGDNAQNRLAALDQSGEANAAYRSFQKRVRRDDRSLGIWMARKDCSQPQAPFDKFDTAKNSFNQGRAFEAKAKCMLKRAGAWDPEPWIKAHADFAAEEATLFAKTAEIKRRPVMDAAGLYAVEDRRVSDVWAKANSEYADAKRYARQDRIAAERRAAATAANARQVVALNAAISNVLRAPGASNRYRKTTTRSRAASGGDTITLTSRKTCPGAGQKQTRFGCMTDAEFSPEEAAIAKSDAVVKAYYDNRTAIQQRAPDKPDVIKNPGTGTGILNK